MGSSGFGSVWDHPASLVMLEGVSSSAVALGDDVCSSLTHSHRGTRYFCSCPAFTPWGKSLCPPDDGLVAQVPEDALDPVTADPQKCFTCPGKEILQPLLSGCRKEVCFPTSC